MTINCNISLNTIQGTYLYIYIFLFGFWGFFLGFFFNLEFYGLVNTVKVMLSQICIMKHNLKNAVGISADINSLTFLSDQGPLETI